jgi:hypothetical protein
VWWYAEGNIGCNGIVCKVYMLRNISNIVLPRSEGVVDVDAIDGDLSRVWA